MVKAGTYEIKDSGSRYEIKDSGSRAEFAGGMVRDTEDGKPDWTSLLHGPMAPRWVDHCTKGRSKYPDPRPGVPNWTLGVDDPAVAERGKRSAFRHFMAWINDERDEDHAAGVFFNINLVEACKIAQAGPSAVPHPDVPDDTYRWSSSMACLGRPETV